MHICRSERETMADSNRIPRPRDPNELAKLIADIATGERADLQTDDGRDLAAVLLGRRGGLKGGRARAASLSAERRKEIAEKAAKARWGSDGKATSKS
jgi:hypothetical protein